MICGGSNGDGNDSDFSDTLVCSFLQVPNVLMKVGCYVLRFALITRLMFTVETLQKIEGEEKRREENQRGEKRNLEERWE